MEMPRAANYIELCESAFVWRLGQFLYGEALADDAVMLQAMIVTACAPAWLEWSLEWSDGSRLDSSYSGAYLVEWLTASETCDA